MYFTRNKQANFDTFLSSVMAFSVLYGNKSLGRQLLREALKKKGRVFLSDPSPIIGYACLSLTP